MVVAKWIRNEENELQYNMDMVSHVSVIPVTFNQKQALNISRVVRTTNIISNHSTSISEPTHIDIIQ